jgi:hypothetical protein
MSKENLEAFQRGVEAGNRGDVDGVLREAAEDVVFLGVATAGLAE